MKTLIAAAALALAACATSSTSGPNYYRAKGQDDRMTVTARLDTETGLIEQKNVVTTLIDGAPVSRLAVGYGSREATATYKGMPVITDCAAASNGAALHFRCLVTINGERAARIVLTPQ